MTTLAVSELPDDVSLADNQMTTGVRIPRLPVERRANANRGVAASLRGVLLLLLRRPGLGAPSLASYLRRAVDFNSPRCRRSSSTVIRPEEDIRASIPSITHPTPTHFQSPLIEPPSRSPTNGALARRRGKPSSI